MRNREQMRAKHLSTRVMDGAVKTSAFGVQGGDKARAQVCQDEDLYLDCTFIFLASGARGGGWQRWTRRMHLFFFPLNAWLT